MKTVDSFRPINTNNQPLQIKDTSSIRKYFDRSSVELSIKPPTNSVPEQSLRTTTEIPAPVARQPQRGGFLARCRRFMQHILPGRHAPRPTEAPAMPQMSDFPASAHDAVRARLPALKRFLEECSDQFDDAALKGKGLAPHEVNTLGLMKYADYLRAFVIYQISREICGEITSAECDKALTEFIALQKHLPISRSSSYEGRLNFGDTLVEDAERSAKAIKVRYFDHLYGEATGRQDTMMGPSTAISRINDIYNDYK